MAYTNAVRINASSILPYGSPRKREIFGLLPIDFAREKIKMSEETPLTADVDGTYIYAALLSDTGAH